MDNDLKWFAFALLFAGIPFCVMSLGKSYERSVTKPELTKLQNELVQLGYGEFKDGKFELGNYVIKGEYSAIPQSPFHNKCLNYVTGEYESYSNNCNFPNKKMADAFIRLMKSDE